MPETKKLVGSDMIIARMVESNDYNWWYDEDTSRWHAINRRTGLRRFSKVSRDNALMWLWRAESTPSELRAHLIGLTMTGSTVDMPE